ncbi:MAG: hypothetical protein U9R25_10695 [Chloroflexota bacterium]|nr:hypothetical protein [Chloroflexota bacterium]
MALQSYVVEGRAHLLARLKLVGDLLLAAALYFGGAPLLFLLAPAIDIILLLPYLRYVKRSPAVLTLGTLLLSALLLALAPAGLGTIGVTLWVLYPLIPLAAAFVLGRRNIAWQAAALTVVVALGGGYRVWNNGQDLVFDQTTLIAFLLAIVICVAVASWLMARTLQADPGNRDLLGSALTVVKGVIVIPFNWVVGGINPDALQLELHQLKRQHNPRWIVLDIAPAGELGRRDLTAIDQAAEGISSTHCTIVLARPPVDALGHLDIARPVVGRIERFATVPQAVEAGLRRLGWTKESEQAQRVVTTL